MLLLALGAKLVVVAAERLLLLLLLQAEPSLGGVVEQRGPAWNGRHGEHFLRETCKRSCHCDSSS